MRNDIHSRSSSLCLIITKILCNCISALNRVNISVTEKHYVIKVKTMYCNLISIRNQAFCMHDYYHIQDVQQASLHVLTDNASQLAGSVMMYLIALMEAMRLVAVSFCHYSSYFGWNCMAAVH